MPPSRRTDLSTQDEFFQVLLRLDRNDGGFVLEVDRSLTLLQVQGEIKISVVALADRSNTSKIAALLQ